MRRTPDRMTEEKQPSERRRELGASSNLSLPIWKLCGLQCFAPVAVEGNFEELAAESVTHCTPNDWSTPERSYNGC